jgi:ribosome biogenesis GTPase
MPSKDRRNFFRVVSKLNQVESLMPASGALHRIGWKAFFEQQLEPGEESLIPARIAAHHGSQVILFSAAGELALDIQLMDACGDIAVGDWILLNSTGQRAKRRLDRETLISRKAAGQVAKEQLIAANVDTLLIVSSCNQDFSLSRFERYLAVAFESKTTPVVVLTKSDLCVDPAELRQQVERLHTGLVVETLDARDPDQVAVLDHWCRPGQTVALVGSSGVGKSTLANSLGANHLATAAIRADDDKGRHTTTSRSMHAMRQGGWLIDNPGMRELQLPSCEQGVADVFEDVMAFTRHCRFRNCRHESDAGCAAVAAVEAGELDGRRLKSFLKLRSEQERNSESMAERRDKDRKLGKFYKSVQANNRKVKKEG